MKTKVVKGTYSQVPASTLAPGDHFDYADVGGAIPVHYRVLKTNTAGGLTYLTVETAMNPAGQPAARRSMAVPADQLIRRVQWVAVGEAGPSDYTYSSAKLDHPGYSSEATR